MDPQINCSMFPCIFKRPNIFSVILQQIFTSQGSLRCYTFLIKCWVSNSFIWDHYKKKAFTWIQTCVVYDPVILETDSEIIRGVPKKKGSHEIKNKYIYISRHFFSNIIIVCVSPISSPSNTLYFITIDCLIAAIWSI